MSNITGEWTMADAPKGRADQTLAELDEAGLMARLARRDHQALEILARRHFAYAFRVAARLLDDPAEAEDITQDVFLKLWARPRLWQPGKARFTTWLYRVVSNAAIDRLRRRRHEPLERAMEMPDQSAGPETKTAQSQTRSRVISALDELPPRQKLALVLTYYQGCSNAESARIMELSVDALESLLARGRRKLRELLADDLADLIDRAPADGSTMERTNS
jgi:RNA polymerase sigma-70 factor (ECF subfamily)